MRPVRSLTSIAVLVLLTLSVPLMAQDPPFVAGLRAPIEMAFTHQGNIIVSETGGTPNAGRLSLVDRTSGTRRTLIDGLPSGLHVMGATISPSGPSGLALQGSTLYVTIGNGDSVTSGPLPGTEQPNPSPSSPILSSVLALQSSTPLDQLAGGYVLEPSHHARLKSGETLTLQNGTPDTMTVRVVVDFPDYTNEPRPDFPANVRLANVFGVAAIGQTLYVVDASQNTISRVDANTGAYTVLTTFAKVTNPTPVGPPVIDAVPNSVRVRGNELLVTLLTGFPFPAGKAEVRRVNISTGAHEPLVGNLSSALDSAPLGSGPQSPLLVMEFSTNQMQSAPGRLLLARPGAEHTVVAANLITPTSVLVDRRNGDVFVTHLGPGLIRRYNAAAVIPLQRAGSVIAVAGSTAGAYASQFRTAAQASNPNPFAISGSFVFHPVSGAARQLGYTLAPYQTRSYADLAGDMGVTGIGSIDVVPAVGPPPAMVVRIVEQSSPCKPSVQVPQLARDAALAAGAGGTLITHVDDATQRFNVGIRGLDEGATVTATLYTSDGVVRATITRSIAADTLLHTGGSDLMGVTVRANESIAFKVDAGAAVIYGSSANNDGTGMTVQIAAVN